MARVAPGSLHARLLGSHAPAVEARRARLAERARGTVVELPAPLDELADASVDTVVSVFALCSVDDPGSTLAAVARVLRPGGELLFLEHTAGYGMRRLSQRLFSPGWQLAARGCRLDLDVPAAIRAAGLVIAGCDRFSLPTVPLLRTAVHGVARHPAPRPAQEAPS